ncbi:MAG: TIGR00730 family Rossman fold protein [Phycisphaerales bacterium]|nr:TIGR00730 family Rossman fold protein [Phycisphaerales bacterium]
MTESTPEFERQHRYREQLRRRVDSTLFPEEDAPSPIHEIRFLEGPQQTNSDQKILDTVNQEFERSFSTFGELGPCIAFFGSARTDPDDPLYRMCRETAELVSREGFTIMTGGGPGMMQAANQGANDAGGRSVACAIELPNEESTNPYVNRGVDFKHFFVRKVVMVKYSFGFVILPGGVGTMDEMFEILTLIQTGKIREFPVVLMGRAYWSKLLEFLETMVEYGTISSDDLDLFHVTDDPRAACDYITAVATRRFDLQKGAPAACRLDWEQMRGNS